MPTYNLDLHIFFQLTQVIFDSWFLWPHQKFLIILSKSLHMVFGSKKQIIVYMGTTCATALIRTSLPPMKRSFSFHPTSFLLAFSLILAKTCVFYFPIKEGRPRYFLCRESCIEPRMLRISSLVAEEVFGLKKTEDLLGLIFLPDAAS